MDHSFVMHVKKSVSVVKFPDGPPKRSLDLGCGVSHQLASFSSYVTKNFISMFQLEGRDLGAGRCKGMARL